MPKLDEAKERLKSLRFWLGIVVGIFVAVVGWIANNYKTADNLVLFGAVVVLISLIIAFVLVNQRIEKRIKDIGEMRKDG